jgi:hypothetical protein
MVVCEELEELEEFNNNIEKLEELLNRLRIANSEIRERSVSYGAELKRNKRQVYKTSAHDGCLL